MTRRTHPVWCSGGHHCTHAEHRSQPVALRGRHGVSAVVSLVEPHGARPFMELILSVRLDGLTDDARSRESARLLAAVTRALVQEHAR